MHQAIVKGLRKRGIVVYDMPQPGDVLCYGPDCSLAPVLCGRWIPMEFKSDQKTRGYKPEKTKSQERQSAPIPIVHTLAEGLELFGLQE